MVQKKALLLAIIMHGSLNARESDSDSAEQLKIGNLALPGSQQPSALLGFGQNIVDKGDLQAFLFPDSFIGHGRSLTEVVPSILYGIRDDLSVFFQFPIAAKFKSDGLSSTDIEDFSVQLEYLPYAYKTPTSASQITLVSAFYLPTGNVRKDPPTGFGAPSFFLGATAAHLSTEWYAYVSPGAWLTTKGPCIKFGNQFYYQAGFGKNIAYSSEKWILSWIIELTGLYIQKRKINGIIDQNFGGNIILISPSIWFSTQRFVFQAGIAPVVSEKLFGNQTKDFVYISLNLGWKFN